MSNAPETRFDGVSLAEVLVGGTGLYEVTTTSGVPVRLHDMLLTRLDHDPDRRTLLMEFLPADPQWTPEAARHTPLAVFAFDGVEVVEHQDDPAEPGTPEDALGQVQGFDYHQASGIFALSAFTTYWAFQAASLVLTLRPTDGGRCRLHLHHEAATSRRWRLRRRRAVAGAGVGGCDPSAGQSSVHLRFLRWASPMRRWPYWITGSATVGSTSCWVSASASSLCVGYGN